MAIQSIPVIPAQPNQAQYGIASLFLFPQFDRAGYLRASGEQAPLYDPGRRQKTWFDSSIQGADDDVVQYTVITGTAVRKITMTVAEARTVNLPGVRTFSPYTPAPTTGAWLLDSLGRHPMNVLWLADKADAEQLAAGIGGRVDEETRLSVTTAYVYDPGENRRVYIVTGPGGNEHAGELLRMKYNWGVGAPGHWNNPSAHQPIWVHELDPGEATMNKPDPRPAREVPIRDLLPNEKLQVGGPLGGVIVVRTDLQNGTGPGGGLTGAQAAQLARVSDLQEKIAQILGVS